MVRTVTKARKAIVKAAQRGAERLRTVAGEAAGAAAEAAAGIVLKSAANALESGRSGVVQSTPTVKKTLGRAAKRTIGHRRASASRKRSVRSARVHSKTTRKKAGPKHKAKRRSR